MKKKAGILPLNYTPRGGPMPTTHRRGEWLAWGIDVPGIEPGSPQAYIVCDNC